jgi:intein/homing endonuclease
MSVAQQNYVEALERRIASLENRIGDVNYEMRAVARHELVANANTVEQAEMQFGMYTALCIETIDIWKQNRIRFFCPLFHNPLETIKKLPWANAVSSLGGFDDCGATWVPPAGSTVCIIFENGNRSSPYYIGTTWQRNRGPDGQHNWGYNIEEYYQIWEGQRKGYLVGPNDGSQVYPPWNTENYNGYDLSSLVDFASNPEAQKLITYPNIFGFKTPEKHYIKMVDGDPKCNRKWKRFEIMSSCGNWIMLKDDHLHYSGQWAHPDCGGEIVDGETSCVEGAANSSQTDKLRGGFAIEGLAAQQIGDTQVLTVADSQQEANTTDTTPKLGKKKEDDACEGNRSNKKIIGGHPSTGSPVTKYYQSQIGANPFFKHSQECRPYRGSPTPQNNMCDLPQSGIQIMSISGHTFVMDDSVEEPSNPPTWDREFDFGCNDHYVGRCVAATDYITLSNGKRAKAGELCEEETFVMLDVDQDGNFREVKAIAEPNKVEKVLKITLENGHELIRNEEHPLWAMERNKNLSTKQRKGKVLGWTPCSKLYEGQYIAIANSLPAWSNNSNISKNDAKLLGYLIGDGGFTGVNVKFSQQNNKQLNELKEIVEIYYNCNLKKLGTYDYHIASKGRNNLVIKLLKDHNLMGCHSRNKQIPSAIFESSEEITSIFLNRLFSTDGWASSSKNGCGQIGFCSISKQLVLDVQHLCQKIGIHGKIRCKTIKPSNLVKKASSAWYFEIYKSQDIMLFDEKVGIFGKETALNKLIEKCKKRKHNQKWIYDQLPNSLRWSKIKKIEELDPQLTIAIQVPRTHTFLTEVWEHNTYWKSATGHLIEMSDVESPPGDDGSKLRGQDNYIKILTATGNKIELNDHTESQKDCPGCPPNIAGAERGIHLRSTSNHTIDMVDETNEQCAPCRMEGGVPIPKAKKAFVRIRTGYGLEMTYNDDYSQEETQQQFIQIFCPQKDNTERGPHIHRYQEAPSGPGLVFLRVGGNYIVSTYDNHVTVVGDEEKNPSDLIEVVTKTNLVYTKDVYVNVTDKLHLFYAKEIILLLAGQDCPDPQSGASGPCFGSVIVYDYSTGCIKISDRVFASTSPCAPQVSIFQLAPFMKCPTC